MRRSHTQTGTQYTYTLNKTNPTVASLRQHNMQSIIHIICAWMLEVSLRNYFTNTKAFVQRIWRLMFVIWIKTAKIFFQIISFVFHIWNESHKGLTTRGWVNYVEISFVCWTIPLTLITLSSEFIIFNTLAVWGDMGYGEFRRIQSYANVQLRNWSKSPLHIDE